MQHPNSAITTFTKRFVVLLGLLFILLVILIFLIGITNGSIIFISAISLLYFIDLLFNFALVLSSLKNSSEYKVTSDTIALERSWPSYTVFCPLYKEAAILSQFVKAMDAMDYPKNKLNIMLLLEEGDDETIEAASNMDLPDCFSIVIVPFSLPKTKPKACNYGLLISGSEYSVIYDAEDIPDTAQLKKAVLAFESAPGDIACLQAKLNFYNPRQNLLTRLFTLEYSLWFNLVLVGLQNFKAPVPLGGTSNHFRSNVLKGLQGWDPYNVTEDCDLGIRLYKQGFRTGILDSDTLEEANSRYGNWFRQRSRWIKGYMQTYLVHTRKPSAIKRYQLDPHIFTFYLIVGGKVMTLFINPLMWLLTLAYFFAYPIFGSSIHAVYPAPVFYIAVFTLIAGNFLYMYYYILGSAQRGQWGLIKYVLFVPIYWLMMSIAAYYGLYQLIVKPHYWEKTQHGLHLKKATI